MCGFSGPEAYSAWTAECDGAVVVLEGGSFVCDVFLQRRHVRERVHVKVLVVCQDEDDIGLLLPSSSRIGEREWPQGLL